MFISRLHAGSCRRSEHDGTPFPDRRPARVRNGMAGFTLIEIMVVLLICLGLVTLMTTLYRSVGKSAIALRGGQQEWKTQQQMREQLLHLFPLKSAALPPIVGHPAEIYFTGWQSGATALDGKPVLGYYHYVASERVLYYQEQPLPPWWQGVKSTYELSGMQSEVRAAPSRKMLTGVESLAFVYLQKGVADMHSEYWAQEWQDPEMPKLIQLQFTKAGRSYTILFETRGTDA